MGKMIVVAIGLMAALAYGSAEATVFVVSQAPPACVNPSGGVVVPTIGAAVTAAAAGDRIYVCPGTYPENVVVPPAQSNLTILGIDRPLVVPGGQSQPGFAILASGVRIQGFEVAGFEWACGILVGDQYTPPQNPPSGVILLANVMHDNDAGICFANAGGNEARDNTVERNFVGIGDFNFVGSLGPNLVIGNRVRANSFSGIVAGANAATRIDMNEVSSNYYGIRIEGSRGAVVSRNTVVKNEANGIHAFHACCFKIDHNTVRDNVQSGIVAWSSYLGSVDDNSVARNAEGIRLEDAESCQVFRNVVQQNASVGINALSLEDGNVFLFNTASGNRGLDCNWDGSDTPTFTANRCRTENPPGAWD